MIERRLNFKIQRADNNADRHRSMNALDSYPPLILVVAPASASAKKRIQKTERPGHGLREAEDAPVAVPIQKRVVGFQQEGAAPLGEEVVAGHGRSSDSCPDDLRTLSLAANAS